MTFPLSRWACDVKFEHRFVNLIPELRISVCGGNQARHKLLLLHLAFFLKHHLKISSSLRLDLTELGCEKWPKVPLGIQSRHGQQLLST